MVVQNAEFIYFLFNDLHNWWWNLQVLKEDMFNFQNYCCKKWSVFFNIQKDEFGISH